MLRYGLVLLCPPMRPLVIFTGQGVARADGFNLTRRVKGLPEFRSILSRVARHDRQNLDALLRAAVAHGAPPAAWIGGLRALCLKERRTTLRKTIHRDLFGAISEASQRRVVVHLTASIDGLSTTFLTRDGGARWAPYDAAASLDDLRRDLADVCRRGTGLLHYPLHGEVGLYVSEGDGERLQTAYHQPKADPDGTTWASSLIVGPGRGLKRLEHHLPSSALARDVMDGLLRGGELNVASESFGEFLPADLLVVGYGANDRGLRASLPFERLVSAFPMNGGQERGVWRALLYAPATAAHVKEWFESSGFSIVEYGDGDLALRVSSLLATVADAREATLPGSPY